MSQFAMNAMMIEPDENLPTYSRVQFAPVFVNSEDEEVPFLPSYLELLAKVVELEERIAELEPDP